MAYNEIEKRFLGVMAERDFPTLPVEPTAADKAPAQAEMKPTPKSPVLGGVADFVYKVRDLANQYEIKDFVPLLGGMGVGDLLVGKAPEEIEEWAYGNSPVRINPYAGQTASFVPEIKPRRQEQLADALMLGADVLPVAGAAKGAKKIIKAAENLPVGASIKPISSAPVTDLGFYSAVEDAALNVQRKSGAGQAFLNDIAKGSNVTKDEIKWIGLDDFLQGKKNVTKQEVQDYIAQNKVDIKEVTLGGAEPYDAQRLAQLESEYKALKQHPIDDPSFGENKYDEMIRLMNIRDQSTTQTLYDAADQATRSAQRAQRQGNNITAEKYFREAELLNTRAEKLDLQGQGMSNPPKFGQYTLPGGENYREILLTLPKSPEKDLQWKKTEQGFSSTANDMEVWVHDAGNGSWIAGIEGSEYVRSDSADQAKAEIQRRLIEELGGEVAGQNAAFTGNFHSSHWDQPNVLAHIRVNDRVDADGKKMLLVEEVQSDWHQAGRDKGYKTKESLEAWYNQNKLEDDPPFAQLNSEQLSTIERNRNAGMGGDAAVPDAPMKDTWYQLALKRVLKYAADNGYERVGLTTGARQAERYDLSKQVEKLTVRVSRDGTYSLWPKATNGIVSTIENKTASELPDIVGKELADKIIKGTEKAAYDSPVVFSGVDLKIGGEGMKKYYDEVYPQFLAKYGKKWGAKVGETTIEVGGGKPTQYADYDAWNKARNGKSEPVRFVDITPEMRESVKKGQPMFVAAPVATGAGSATMQGQEEQ